MIFSYKGHQSLNIEAGKVSVISTNSPTVFSDLINGVNDFNDDVKLFDDSYNRMELSKSIDFDSDLIFTHKLYEKYSKQLLPSIISNMTEESKNQIDGDIRKVFSKIQEGMFMTDLPLEINYDGDLKRLLNYCHIHFAVNSTSSPYDIIMDDLKLHLECNLKSVLCFSNLANYVSKAQFGDLTSQVESMGIPLLLVEFSEFNKRDFYQNANVLFIDQDFIDWKA